MSFGTYSRVAPQLRQTTSFTTLGCGTVLTTLTILGLQCFILLAFLGFDALFILDFLRDTLGVLHVVFGCVDKDAQIRAVVVLVLRFFDAYRIAIQRDVALKR